MAQRPPDPADHDSWESWQEASSRAGRLPVQAKPIPFALLFVLLAGALSWWWAGQLGGGLDEDVLRRGTAQVTGGCHGGVDFHRCPAEITWDDGGTERRDVWADTELTGTVAVEEHLTDEVEWSVGARTQQLTKAPVAWSADHRPHGRPWLFPVVFGGCTVAAMVLAAFGAAYAVRRLVRRSRDEWAAARRAAGRST